MFGAHIEGGVAGALVVIALVVLNATAFGTLGAALALKAKSASTAQGIFPLVFVILFLSSAFFPENLLLEPARTIAEWNPLSLIADGLRDPIISGPVAAADARGARRHRDRRRASARRCASGACARGSARRMTGIAYDARATWTLMRRGINEIARVPGAAIPGVLAPSIFMCGLTAVFGSLTQLPGFTTDDYINFILPVGFLQGAAFTGAATGVNLARDIELGWFDRLLASPAPRGVLLAGTVLSASLRVLMPITLLMIVGLVDRCDLPGRGRTADRAVLRGLLRGGRRLLRSDHRDALQDAGGRAADAGGRVHGGAVHDVLRAAGAAHRLALRRSPKLNPVTQILEAVRQGFIGDVTWADTWPGLVALAGLAAVLVDARPAVAAPRRRVAGAVPRG